MKNCLLWISLKLGTKFTRAFILLSLILPIIYSIIKFQLANYIQHYTVSKPLISIFNSTVTETCKSKSSTPFLSSGESFIYVLVKWKLNVVEGVGADKVPIFWGQHSTEVAFVLCTQQPRAQFWAFPTILLNSWCCWD